MSTFACPVVRLKIVEHPNADAIEIAEVGLYQSIVRKGQYKTGDLAVYIPESALVPEQVLRDIGMWDEGQNRGKCSGSLGNRVKAIKLRGVVSQGLIYPLPDPEVAFKHDLSEADFAEIKKLVSEQISHPKNGTGKMVLGSEITPEQAFAEGQDLAEFLGITKYQPKLPAQFAGVAAGQLAGLTPKFDIENLQGNPRAFALGEPIQLTEKLHGTCCILGWFPPGYLASRGHDESKFYRGQMYVGSKGLTRSGVVFNPNLDTSTYTRVAKELNLFEKICSWAVFAGMESPFVVMGEIFGPGVQDLHYGLASPVFRAFEVWGMHKSEWIPATNSALESFCESTGITQVPHLYRGPYEGVDHLKGFVDGQSTFGGNIREGIVVRSEDGSKLYKLVSNDYKFRDKGGKKEVTEYD